MNQIMDISFSKQIKIKFALLVGLIIISLVILNLRPRIEWPPRIPDTKRDIMKELKKETVSMFSLTVFLAIYCIFAVILLCVFLEHTTSVIKIVIETILMFFVVFFLLQIVVHATKLILARPRPTFYNICKPDKLGYCDISSASRIESIYNGRLSYPSGHVATVAYFTLASWYIISHNSIAKKISLHFGKAFMFIFYGLFLLLGCVAIVYVNSSRVSDHYHSTADVICGFLLGSIAASFFAPFFMPL